jgi:nicotinate phosphoribosyltransferase
VIQDGEIVAERPEIPQMRKTREKDINALDPGVRRIMNPHTYHVSLSQKLWDLKQSLIKKAQS